MSQIEQRVIDTITSRGGRVTAADVVESTGFALNMVTRELNRIASISHAVLEVSPGGTIMYVFSPDLAKIFDAAGFRKKLLELAKSAWSVAFYLIRCSFGVLLIASFATLLMIFVVTIVLILVASGAGGGHHGGHHGGGHHHHHHGLDFDFFDIENMIMFFAWWQRDVGNPSDYTYLGQPVDLGDQGFLFNCFSFLFGDGNPNRSFAEHTWQYVAELIRRNNGVLTAEQVAPYAVSPTAREDAAMFPVLVRFDGVPQVTDVGEIVYVFPNMQVTASGALRDDLPEIAEEKQWRFTETPMRRLDFVLFFAIANLGGWYAVLRNPTVLHLIGPYASMAPVMLDYAIFFVLFPLMREFCNAVRNGVIQYRNDLRKKAHAKLALAQAQSKIRNAQIFAQRLQYLNSSQVVYTTATDLLDQEFAGTAWTLANPQQNPAP